MSLKALGKKQQRSEQRFEQLTLRSSKDFTQINFYNN